MALVLRYPLDAIDVSRNTLDYSGNGNTGVLGADLTIVSGIRGNAASLPGTGTCVTTTEGATSLAIGDVFTILAWVRTATPTTRMTIFAPNYVGGKLGPAFGFGNPGLSAAGGLELYSKPTGNTSYTNASLIPANQWTHVAVSRNSTTSLAFYVNGVSVAVANNGSQLATIGSGTEAKFVGQRGGGALPFAGEIDDLMVYNEALSRDDIVRLMGAPNALFFGGVQ